MKDSKNKKESSSQTNNSAGQLDTDFNDTNKIDLSLYTSEHTSVDTLSTTIEVPEKNHKEVPEVSGMHNVTEASSNLILPTTASSQDAGRVAAIEQQARKAKQDKDWETAVDLWSQCLSIAPENLGYKLELAIAQRESRNFDASLDTLQRAELMHGEDCWIYDNRARVYFALGDAQTAVDYWQSALTLAEGAEARSFFESQIALGERKLSEKKFEQSLEDLSQLLERGNTTGAYDLLETKLALAPLSESQADRIAILFQRFGVHKAVVQLWHTVTQNDPSVREAWLKLAIACRQAGEYERSLSVLKTTIQRFGNDCWIQDNLARLSVLEGNRRKAEQHWTQAARLAPNQQLRKEFEQLVKRSQESVSVSFDDGWVSFSFPASQSPDALLLTVDGETCADVEWVKNKQEGSWLLRARCPSRYLDGNPHLFEARDVGTYAVLGVDAFVTPVIATPWQAILKYSRAPFPGALSPMARDRYRCMQAWMSSEDALASSGQSLRLRQLAMVHEIILSGFEQPRRQFPRLDFTQHETPKVSVVIPVHNHFEITYYCLASLLFAYNRASFEVIVVDDGSEDQTVERLPEVARGISVVRHEVAQGFVGACNAGAKHARGDFIVFLNNDTEPTAYWLDEMLHIFSHGDRVGLVGSKLVYPDGQLQEAGGIVWSNGDPWNFGRGSNEHDPIYNYTREVDYVSGASIMLPRSLWEQVGGFSLDFAPAYFEDTDLAFKVKAEGFRVVYAPLSRVYHFEGKSCGTDTTTTTGLKRFQEINRPKFKHKWFPLFRDHGEYGETPELEKDRNTKFRILFIDAEIPRPDRDAGSYAAIQEIRLVHSFGAKVTFLPTNLAYMGSYTEDLQRLGVEVLYAPFIISVEDALSKRGTEFHAVYITRYYVARDVLPLVRKYMPQAKVMFCNADLHFLRQLRTAIERGKDPGMIQEAIAIRNDELAIMRDVDVTLSYNTIEHAVVHSHIPGNNIVLCPWVVESVDKVVPYAERRGVAFLGNYRHPPNFGAVEFFALEVLPLLRALDPGIEFEVYGSHIDKRLDLLADSVPGMELKGWVDDVRQVYESCRVFVAPLRSGAGIKGKVIGALGFGLPQVLSPIAAEGTGLRDGLEVRIAETPQQWCEAVLNLYQDPTSWEKMSKAALEYATLNYSFKRGRTLMKAALAEAEVYVADDDRGLFGE